MPSQHKEVLCTYHYDALDCLIGLNSAKQDTLQRFYCKSRLATEIQGLARCSVVQQGDLLLAQQKRLGETLETALMATDQQRSVMHTVGGSSLAIAYSPYGHRRAESGLTSLLGFNGERPDTVTGHYLLGNGYRAFNPVLMRFNSPDSFSPFGKGGINAYAYCSGDPVSRSDPSGENWFSLTTEQLHRLWLSYTNKSFGSFDLAATMTLSAKKSKNMFLLNSSRKKYSTTHIMPSNQKPRSAESAAGETLFKKTASAINGSELVAVRKQHKKLGLKLDKNYYRSDLIEVYYNSKIKKTLPALEVFNMPHFGDLEHHFNLMRAVNLEISMRFASESQRSLIKINLDYAVALNRSFRRIP